MRAQCKDSPYVMCSIWKGVCLILVCVGASLGRVELGLKSGYLVHK